MPSPANSLTDTSNDGSEILAWAKAGDAAKVESAWMADVATLPDNPAFYDEWARAMRHAGAHAKVEDLAILVAEDRLNGGRPDVAFAILEPIAKLYPQSTSLRPVMVRAIRAQFEETPALKAVIRTSGIEGKSALNDALKIFHEWIKFFPGQVFQHYAWGEGVVKDFDLSTQKVTVDFPEQPGKSFTIEGVRKFLKHVPAGSYLARRTKEPEALKEIALADPANFVKVVLSSQPDRQLKQADLKALIINGVLTESGWNTWWGKAREAIKTDSMLDFDASGGARALLRLRDKPRTLEQEIDERFFDPEATLATRAELIRRLAKWPKDSAAPTKLAERMAKRLEEDWKLAADESAARRLEVAFMISDLASQVPGAQIPRHETEPLLAAMSGYEALGDFDNVDYAIRALGLMLERDGAEGFDAAARVIPGAPVRLAQAIWKSLDPDQHHDLAVRALQQLFDDPLANIDAYAWAMRSTLDGSWAHIEEDYPAAALVPEMVSNIDAWHRTVSDGGRRTDIAKSALSRMRTLLSSDKFALLGKAVEPMSRETITKLRQAIQMSPAFPEAFKAQADRAIRIARRDMEEDHSTPGVPASASHDEAAHYCTARSQLEKMAELREITSVKIPTNAKVIEEARMEGDLRENAGYQYAKEEQKMLVQTQATLNDLLGRAHVISARDVETDKVGFGTRVRLKNLRSGQEESYTVLGRWEADPEHHVISIQAPMAQQFLGHKAGDHVTISHPGGGSTDYELVEIANALESGKWDAPAGK